MTILAVTASTSTMRYSVQVATEGDQVRAAQGLRHRVFAEELGATLHSEIRGRDAGVAPGTGEAPGAARAAGHAAQPVADRPRTGTSGLDAAAAQGVPPARRLGVRAARARPGLQGGRPSRPALAGPGRPSVHA